MKIFFLIYIIVSLNFTTLFSAEVVSKGVSVKEKKARFYSLLVPAVKKVHTELLLEYKSVKEDMKHSRNLFKKDWLKEQYQVKSDAELLARLKPHPQSIVLAQAAMESAWATSRFFTEANNVFGIWSTKRNEPRIAAGEKRNGKRTIWLRKFDTIEDSIRAYYKIIATGRAYREFRALRVKTDDPYKLVKKLDKYSEIGEHYGKELAQVIRYNGLTKYDK